MTDTTLARQRHSVGARRCIFCGDRAGSGEHTFPTWLNGVFSKCEYEFLNGATSPQWARGQRDFRTGETTEQAWSATEVASLRCKKVCSACNQGWMAALEGRSKPLLEPMILGHPHTLNQVEQLTVATWATKTAMVLEHTLFSNDVSDFFSDDQRRLLMDQDRPPGLLRVRAACLEGMISPARYACTRLQIQRGGAPFCKLHLYTLQLNMLVLQVIRSDPPPPSYAALKELAVPADIEVPVFPPVEQFFWPPQKSLDNEGMKRYVTRTDNPPALPGP